MTALITGATGFVGAAVLRKLVAEGLAVKALVRPSSDRRNLEGVACTPVEGDLRDIDSLRAALRGCDILFHVAADYRMWARNPMDIVAANVQGTRNIMQAAREAGIGRLVYTSSVATLAPSWNGRPTDESTAVGYDDMIGGYKRSKFLAEEVVRRMTVEAGLPAVIVNPSMPVGPRDIKPTPTGRLVVEAASGRMPAYVDTGLNVVHVEDVADGHWLAFEKGEVGARYVLGGENMALRDILAEIAAIIGRRPPKISLPHGLVMPIARLAEAVWKVARLPGEPFATVDAVNMAKKKMFYSSNKAKRELGYAPRPAKEGLRDAVYWYRENGYLG